MHDAQRTTGEEVRGGIDVACIFGAQSEGLEREAVLGYVLCGLREDGGLDGGEGRQRWWVV